MQVQSCRVTEVLRLRGAEVNRFQRGRDAEVQVVQSEVQILWCSCAEEEVHVQWCSGADIEVQTS